MADYNRGSFRGSLTACLLLSSAAFASSFPAAAFNAPETIWDLDRVIVNGGGPENADPALPDQLVVPALGTWERTPSGWIAKATDPNPRVFGQLVILPDGSLLAVGGQRDVTPEGEFQEKTRYWFGAHRFAPGAPGAPGSWSAMEKRPKQGDAPAESRFASVYGTLEYSMPRGYHSVAVLLRDGKVAIMGGERTVFEDTDLPTGYDPTFLLNAIPEDSIEIYSPPFTFEAGRPRITQVAPLPTMRYGVEYCIQVNDPQKVDYACLIGVGAATHHFDYGQRYIELMVKRGGCGANSVTILPPTLPAMSPEGYYLLFLVAKRFNTSQQQVAVPSSGAFVKLTFP